MGILYANLLERTITLLFVKVNARIGTYFTLVVSQ